MPSSSPFSALDARERPVDGAIMDQDTAQARRAYRRGTEVVLRPGLPAFEGPFCIHVFATVAGTTTCHPCGPYGTLEGASHIAHDLEKNGHGRAEIYDGAWRFVPRAEWPTPEIAR